MGWIPVVAAVEADLVWEDIAAAGCTADIGHRAAVVVAAAAWEVCHLVVAVVAASEVFVVPTEIASEDLVPVAHHLLGCVDMAGCNQVLERSLVFGHPLDQDLLLVDPAAAVDNSEDIGLEGQVCHIPEEEVHLDVLPEEAVHRNYLMNIPDHPD